mmetsp:Transcript_43896/g.73103  ORF Transcript_43896/g.73103 Transcript_43896/m.73103 type:complete len:374 (+) Transcript_43896:168-1289(+)
MGKKEQKMGAGGDGGVPAVDVRGHAEFFDDLVELVPAKFYVPTLQNEEWMRYKHTKSEKSAAQQARKENSKKAKRLKLDPSQVVSTSEAIKRKAEAGSDDDDEDDDGDEDDDSEAEEEEVKAKAVKAPPKEGMAGGTPRKTAKVPPTLGGWTLDNGNKGGKVSHEELEQRLRKRIEEARTLRKAEESKRKAEEAKNWRKKATGSSAKKRQKTDAAPAANGNKQQAAAPVVENLELTRIQGAGGEEERVKKGLSKRKALEKAEAIQGVMAEGGAKAEKHTWSAAMKRAAGEKVLDDPKLLKKTLKRQEQEKKKSAKKWEDKLRLQGDVRTSKQDKRKSNLKQRKDLVKDQKQERRDKKLLRPGFEGRKEGFINK